MKLLDKDGLTYYTNKVKEKLNTKENTSNKVTSISSSSTNTQYPSAKCVYDSQATQDTKITNLENQVFGDETIEGEGTSLTLNGTLKGQFNEIDLKGNTSQTGTPTPSSPIPVNVVSGDNEINVVGKNLFDKEQETINTIINSAGTLTPNNDYNSSDFINIKSSTSIVLSTNTTSAILELVEYDKNKTLLNRGVKTNSNVYILTTNASTHFVRISYQNTSTQTQLEYGNSSTTYEPYQGNTYNIDLPVENLFNSNLKQGGRYFNNGNFFTADNYVHNENPISVVPGETYTLSATNYSAKSEAGFVFFNNGTYVSGSKQSSQTFTVPSNANQVYCDFYTGSNVTPSDITNIQLEKGSKANSYTPYGTTPIEMCKIGNYQDYFYKDSGKWYLHKEIGKVVLNGSENWGKSSSTANTIFYLSGTIHYKNGTTSSSTDLYCNYFDGKVVWGNNVIGCELYIVDSIRFGLTTSSTITTLEDWKTWLSTHNVVVYYVLATPVNTALEDM